MRNPADIPKAIAILDIGRTHKKWLLFDAHYTLLDAHSQELADNQDEDGFRCEDLYALRDWLQQTLQLIGKRTDLVVEAINVCAHGAALVHVDALGQPLTPLYDYMKPLDQAFIQSFYHQFGGQAAFSNQTGSPALGMLNSGLQLHWLKHKHPEVLQRLHRSLHLPQYLHYLLTGHMRSDISSVGCHTGMWDYAHKKYHHWLADEDLLQYVPEPEPYDHSSIARVEGRNRCIGIGMHDSSAALLPYMKAALEPFMLLSTGTWNIALHPYFHARLEEEDFARDCLYFLLDKHTPVAASRLFLGQEYHHQVQRLEIYFHKESGYHRQVNLDANTLDAWRRNPSSSTLFYPQTMQGSGPIPQLYGPEPDLSQFDSFEHAFHKMMMDLCYLQKCSIELLQDHSPVRNLYISGGFMHNEPFMALLQAYLPKWRLYRADNTNDSALGAALAIHARWQTQPIPRTLAHVHTYEGPLNLDLSHYHPFESTFPTL